MKKYIYTINGLNCGNCAAKIERHLNKDDNIAYVSLDFAAGRLYLTFKEDPLTLEQVANKIKEASDDDLTISYATKNSEDSKFIFKKNDFHYYSVIYLDDIATDCAIRHPA